MMCCPPSRRVDRGKSLEGVRRLAAGETGRSMAEILRRKEEVEALEELEMAFSQVAARLNNVNGYVQHVVRELADIEQAAAALYAAWRKTQQ